MSISDLEIERELLDFMSSLGVRPASYERLQLDGELHRYDIEGEKRGKQHGAYVVHTDGLPAGYVQDWKRGIKATWKYKASGLSDEERDYYTSEEYRQQCAERRRQREEDRQARQKEAAERSRILFEQSDEASETHAYLQSKHIKSHGVHENEGRLMIPLRDISGEVKSLQWIDANGGKRFQPDTALSGLFWSVGLEGVKEESPATILLGEGFATMAKVHELTRQPSVAGISCGQLSGTAQALRRKYPKSQIYVMADNDKGTEERRGFNPGLQSAQEVVKAGLADYIIVPEFETAEDGTDWDDYALKYGEEECARVIASKLEEAPLKARQEKYRIQVEELGQMLYERFEDFCQPVKSPSWLIEDWLPAESLTMLFAASGSGKSFLAADIACAIGNARIEEWHGKRVRTHGDVIYVAGEGQRGLRKRFAGLQEYLGIRGLETRMTIITEPPIIDDKDAKVGIQRLIANIGNISPTPALVYIDTVTACMSGDENKTADASAFVRNCNRIIQEFGCGVALLHHTGLNPETQTRARGSSVLRAAMDMEYRVVKNGHILTLEMTKSKDTEIQPPLVFNMESITVPDFYNAAGELDTTCVLKLNEEVTQSFADEPQTVKKKEKVPKAERFAKDTYQEAAHKYGQLIEDPTRGREVVSVKVEDWRRVFYEMSSADNPNTRKSQFKRARAIMLEERHIVFKKEMDGEEYYCLEPSGDAYDMAITLNIRRRDREKDDNSEES